MCWKGWLQRENARHNTSNPGMARTRPLSRDLYLAYEVVIMSFHILGGVQGLPRLYAHIPGLLLGLKARG